MNRNISYLEETINLNSHLLNVVEIPFNTPVHLPFGTIQTRPSSWLKICGSVGGDFSIGRAEGTALPMQIPLYDDYSGNLSHNINVLIARLYSLNGASLREMLANVQVADLGGTFSTARMTVETTVLDMCARAKGITVFELVSGIKPSTQSSLPYGKSIAENNYDSVLRAGREAAINGASRIKFKLSPSNASDVIQGISDLKREYRELDFMVDANGMFDPLNEDHISVLEKVDKLGLLMIEEPVSRVGLLSGLDAHRSLKSQLKFKTKIALDDSIKSKKDAVVALNEGLGDIINLKPGRVGSFLECLNIADFAKTLGKEIMVGGMFEATPGRTMTLTLAAYCHLLGFAIPGDISLPQERLLGDLIDSDKLKLDHKQNVVFEPKIGWGYRI